MRHSIKLTALLLLIIEISTASNFARVTIIGQLANLVFAFKPTYWLKLAICQEFEDGSWVRICASATYLASGNHDDTFPIFAVKSGNGISVLPGEQSLKNMIYLKFLRVLMLRLLNTKAFAYIGTDV
ncbi:MAG: hypothetical protein IPL10_20035 [Bacteroidetes bacterium]|nr:hypothetical protein [Bacteroidota bacterium]